MDFPGAEFDWKAVRLRWFDYWLKGIDNGIMDSPVVRVFLMGQNRWLDLETWPPPELAYTPAYLREGAGRTDASLNNGLLTFALPGADERPDSFCYDPQDPVPSLVANFDHGPRDHRSLEGRMLTYTSAPLEDDLVVVGPVKAVLYALSSAPDTDWVVRLCDVYPDGRSMSVCDGILRARYRASLQQPELVVPGRIYRFEVDLLATAHCFKAGHCLRSHVTSSDFPRYDRNLNTGGPFGEETCGQAAVNTVFHDQVRPSHLILPVYA
jgi:putative CocE/NonD family hydrolase